MGRIIRRLIVGLVILGVAVPQPVYACTPMPEYWIVTIRTIDFEPADLPDGVVLIPSEGTLLVGNETSYLVRGEILYVDPHSSQELTEAGLYEAFFPDDPSSGYFLDPPPQLPDEVVLVLTHREQTYE